jgi:tRNA dimethylallyltransferase
MRLTGEGPPLVIIAGPTAVGKTTIGIHLAEALGGEIIGADSRQVYRRMDIGTAKPTRAEQERVRHHLVDVMEPDDVLSVAAYQDQARAAIAAVRASGRLPLLVGGTGQYLSALVEGWSIPRVAPDRAIRAALEEEAQVLGAAALHDRLSQFDPDAAARIHPNNVRRVVRAIEVYTVTGQPISALQEKVPPGDRVRVIGLTMERDALYQRADERVEHMVQLGLVDEVRGLLAAGYARDLPSMSSVGYPEFIDYVEGRTDLTTAITRTQNSTHDFIRRQYVWLRRHVPGILWHNVSDESPRILLREIGSWLKTG